MSPEQKQESTLGANKRIGADMLSKWKDYFILTLYLFFWLENNIRFQGVMSQPKQRKDQFENPVAQYSTTQSAKDSMIA